MNKTFISEKVDEDEDNYYFSLPEDIQQEAIKRKAKTIKIHFIKFLDSNGDDIK